MSNNVLELPDRSSARATVAAEVRAEMARAAVTQQRLAGATGIPQSTLSRKLKARGERDALDVDELDRIANALGVPITKFFVTAGGQRGPDGGGASRLGESNPRPSHYKEPSPGETPHLSGGNVLPLRRRSEPARGPVDAPSPHPVRQPA